MGFVIGLLCGGTLGVIIMCLAAVAGNCDIDE